MTNGPDFSHSDYPDPSRPRRYVFDRYVMPRASDRAVTSPPPVPTADVVDIGVVDSHLAAIAAKRSNYHSLDQRRQFRTMLDGLLDLRLALVARTAVVAPPTAAEVEARLAAEVDQIHLTDEG